MRGAPGSQPQRLGAQLPRVDVVVVTHNTRQLSLDALGRLMGTDQGCHLRLIVRDNGSTDGTAEAVQAAFPSAVVEADGCNRGFAAGVNRALAHSRAPLVLLLNSDAWPEPGAVGRLARTAMEHPGAAAVAPRIERPDGALEHSTHCFPSLAVALAAALGARLVGQRLGERLLLHGAWRHDRPRRVDWAVGAALLVRRRALEDVGALDERLFMYAEDLEWCWRASRHGWSVWFEPAALFRHVGDASGRSVYGEHRTSAWVANTHRIYRDARGPLAASAYRALNAAAAGCRELAAMSRGDGPARRHWTAQRRAHLARHGAGADLPPGRA